MKTISSRIKIISFILTFLLVSLIAVTFYLNELSKNDAHLINIAGKQRMLSQRAIKEILLNTINKSPDFLIYHETKEEFFSNLDSLKEGSQDNKITKPTDLKTLDLLNQCTLLSNQFYTISDRIESRVNNKKNINQKEIKNLYDVNNKLLIELEKVVYNYTKISEKKIQHLQYLQFFGGIVTLIVVIITINLTKKIDEEFELFLNHAKQVGSIRCEDNDINEISDIGEKNELLQAESEMKMFIMHVEKVLKKAQYALMESKNTLLSIEDAAKTMEKHLDHNNALSLMSKQEIENYIDVSENITIDSLEKIANTEKMLNKFHTMLGEMVVKMESND